MDDELKVGSGKLSRRKEKALGWSLGKRGWHVMVKISSQLQDSKRIIDLRIR